MSQRTVYDQDGALVVLDEAEASAVVLSEKSTWHTSIKRYVSTRKAWHNANPGEVWLVTCGGREDPYQVTDYGTFDSRGAELSLNDEAIEHARLIWSPEKGENDE